MNPAVVLHDPPSNRRACDGVHPQALVRPDEHIAWRTTDHVTSAASQLQRCLTAHPT
jgi:hypothetical protein